MLQTRKPVKVPLELLMTLIVQAIYLHPTINEPQMDDLYTAVVILGNCPSGSGVTTSTIWYMALVVVIFWQALLLPPSRTVPLL